MMTEADLRRIEEEDAGDFYASHEHVRVLIAEVRRLRAMATSSAIDPNLGPCGTVPSDIITEENC